MFCMMRLTVVFFIVALFVPSVAAAPPQWIVLESSRVGFVASQAGAPVEGIFEAFDADVRFDLDDPESSTAKVVIDIASVNSQSSDRDATIRSASLFDVATWPTAIFEATSFAPGDVAGEFLANGTLTMRDVTKDVVLVFTLSFEGNTAHAAGALDIMRLDYGIGQGMWADTSVVANEVSITIDIHATR